VTETDQFYVHLIALDLLHHAVLLGQILSFKSIACYMQAGLRPVCEFMTFNFAMQAIDQVLLNAVCFGRICLEAIKCGMNAVVIFHSWSGER